MRTEHSLYEKTICFILQWKGYPINFIYILNVHTLIDHFIMYTIMYAIIRLLLPSECL